MLCFKQFETGSNDKYSPPDRSLSLITITQFYSKAKNFIVYHKHWNDRSSNDIRCIIIEAFSGGGYNSIEL